MMNARSKRIALSTGAVIAGLLLIAFSVALLARPPRPSSHPLENLVEPGVVISIRDNVADARVNEIVLSIGGTIDFTDPKLHMVVVRFPRLVQLRDIERIVKYLERFPEVEYATPRFGGLAQ